jgi:hypothetical protein
MVNHLTYYYTRDTEPFRSLSALPDAEAIEIMKALCNDTLFGSRFKDPVKYLNDRKETEQWVREAFIAKGGHPKAAYPIPMVLGASPWLARQSPIPEAHGEIRIPLSTFDNDDVSFTYPDSMVSRWLGLAKPSEYYMPEYHGKVFTISEILSIVTSKGLPEKDWETSLPNDMPPYIEAQVWHHEPLIEYKKRAYAGEQAK